VRDGSGSPGKFCSRAFQSSSLPEAVALNERGTDTRVLRARRLHPAPRSGARILVLVTLPGPRCGVAAKVAGLRGAAESEAWRPAPSLDPGLARAPIVVRCRFIQIVSRVAADFWNSCVKNEIMFDQTGRGYISDIMSFSARLCKIARKRVCLEERKELRC